MKRKSLFALFSILIISGVFLVGSVDAFSYITSGNSMIAFDTDHFKYVDSIQYGESTLDLGTCTNNGIYGKVCVLTGENEYNVTVNFKNTAGAAIDFIYLNITSNIKKIINYDGIGISSLYLSNNAGIDLNNVAPTNISNIYINSGNLDNFKLLINNNTSKNIEFKHNKLETIPDSIRNMRNIYNIKLSDYVSYQNGNNNGSNAKRIFLDDNPIEFVGITKINNNDVSVCDNYYACDFDNDSDYDFERFGYSYLTGSAIYDYKITQNNEIVKDVNGENISGSISNTGITINKPLKPGNYTFEVCIMDTDACDFVDFNVSYDKDIKILSPEDNHEYVLQDNVEIKWGRIGKYPGDFLSGYEYKLEKGNSEIKTGTIFFNDTSSCNISSVDYINCFSTDFNVFLGDSLEDGEYTLTVYLLDIDNNHIGEHDTVRFIISTPDPEDPTISIDRPNSSENESYTYFSWTPVLPTGNYFGNYNWEIRNGNDVVTGGIITDENETGFYIDDLDNGSYTFYLELNYSRDNGITGTVTDGRYSSGKKSFTVDKSYPTISIIRPSETETENITYFNWNANITPGFTFDNYEWSISKNGTLIITGQSAVFTQTSYETGGLNNGEYTFNVKLNYTQDSNGQAGYAIDNTYAATNGNKTFNVNKSNELTITYPSHDGVTLSEAENTFKRTGFTANTFRKYTYTLTGDTLSGDHYYTGGSFTNINQNSFTLRNLRDGEYTLVVTMETDAGNEIDIRRFTVNASVGARIEIISPNKPTYTGNYIKTVPIDFTWNGGGSPLISKYGYKLTNTKYDVNGDGLVGAGDTIIITNCMAGTDNNPKCDVNGDGIVNNGDIEIITNCMAGSIAYVIQSGFVDSNVEGLYSIPGSPISLPNGTYKFEVTMLDDGDKPIIPTESRTFDVTIPTIVEITSPTTGASIPSILTVLTWTGFTPYTCVNYEYAITGSNDYSRTGSANCSKTGFELRNLRDGTYTFKIRMKYNDGVDKYTDYVSSTFSVNASTDKYLNITSPTSGTNYTPVSGTNYWGDYKVPVMFTWNGGGSALIEKYSYKIIDSNSHVILSDVVDKNDSGEYSISAQPLLKGSYTFEVNMLDSDDNSIMMQTHSFVVRLPARITITNPIEGATITSSNTKFTWTGYSDVISRYEYSLVKSGENIDNSVTTSNSFSLSNLVNGDYSLTVWISSGGALVANDTINFTVSVPKKTSGGGGGGGTSSKSHATNNLSVDITNESPNTNERIEVKVGVSDRYTGKVDFTKMQYYSGGNWVDIPVTSKNYVSDYSDDAKLGYVSFSSSDDGEKELSEFLKLSKKGNYRIYAEDKDGYSDYVQFYVGNGGKNNTVTTAVKAGARSNDTEDEVYIARSCKKYKITYSDSLNVYTSPNLNMSEYFMNKDYFKRYIDSKNRYQNGCPTNVGWISTSYSDKTNDNSRYTAPNGKVYFITGKEGNYYSNELNKELRTPTSFGTIQQLKYYIRDRNPLINMATLGPVK